MEFVEYRHLPLEALEMRLGDDAGPGTFEGYANRHGVVDSYDTEWRKGAWSVGGLDDSKYALLDMHDPTKRIGWFYATEDDTGLYVKGEFSKTQAGQDARIQAREGIASELSVGFVRTGVDPDDSNIITGSRLVEVSAITARMASQPGAELAAVRKAALELDRRTPEAPITPADEGQSEEGVPTPEEAYAAELTDDDLTDAPIPGVEKRTVPGSNADKLHDYWTHGDGLAKWLGKPKPWTALYHHLLKYIREPEKAKATAAKWYHDVTGHWAGDKANRADNHRKEVRRVADKAKSEKRQAELEKRSLIDPPDGSYEALIDELREAIDEWAEDQLPSAQRIYVQVIATFPDHVVATIYVDDDYEGVTYSFPYVASGDGEDITLGTAKQVELVTTIEPADADDEGLGERAAEKQTETGEGDKEDSKPEHLEDEQPPPKDEDQGDGDGERAAQELKRKAAGLRLASVKVG